MGILWDNIWEYQSSEMLKLLVLTGNKEILWDKVGIVLGISQESLGICQECPFYGNKSGAGTKLECSKKRKEYYLSTGK